MAKNKTASELRAENRLLKQFRFTQGLASVLNNVVRWGGLVLIARYVFLTVETLAGQETLAKIGISFLAEVKVSEALAWVLASGGVGYGLSQKRLRKNTIERLQGRIQTYERKLDPKRSSSLLTPRGDTRPEDQK